MTTVVELEVPADRLGLAQTFDRVPTFEFQIGGLIGDVAPLVRVTGPDRRTIEDTLESDSSVVVVASVASECSESEHEQWLFRLDFGERLKLFQQIVSANEGAILAARGRDGTWSVQLLYHDRKSVSTCHELFGQYDFGVEVTRINDPTDLEQERTPLTKTQYETIAAAHELGYFDVPRRITLEELAAELDVSHQALSERLRRCQSALVSAELASRLTPIEIDP
ncbi:helix-turn-helix domain-containing protein [Natronobacterium gregoryi]|uniref:Bacterio-opsin activator HTH domain-containing protein n=2 Tax=Natronobacterium gregoryi TaxID=44930 RepID=L0AJE2_NATGS|nr:helix-turn-helix domain-containing protein [Natronobacterium gregoryi]AFZ74018.1 putative DNA binding protein [Natronobacterium gregoryi SP2]ELY70590.1 bacterio-opsin activator HTH domain-containing protein [Natronobacterium gregoryi SP2]PLK20767.1 helix-turn-helix domain-containing protein [Natronobacterium gregoryi SP2]SFJ07596.1 Predicted DNA binding protein, contains HTH domain [Natronobacterium gregoryi]